MRYASGAVDLAVWRQGQDLHVPYPEFEWLEEEIHAEAHQ